ncbi:MAG: hypothetical protein NT169_15345 [Chloroflexi bacterium]|nr:hypothetical protein [Chloroflexota bacterium]
MPHNDELLVDFTGTGSEVAGGINAVASVTILSERRRHAPYGLAGGEPGAVGVNSLQSAASPRRAGAAMALLS